MFFSLLIGAVMLFIALAGVMFVTRKIDWSGGNTKEAEAVASEA